MWTWRLFGVVEVSWWLGFACMDTSPDTGRRGSERNHVQPAGMNRALRT